uniref:TPR_REGION domain-containing protein n=1 Tax=Trichuris muris TaxID=70415 RepID=A0A5S6QB86_TRIMR
MTSFTWKKRVEKQFREHAKRWLTESADDDVDEASPARATKVICLEDAVAKAARLENEAVFYVQNERYADGIKRLQEAIELRGTDARLHDMLSQIYLIRGEDFLAVQSAQRAVECSPLWSDAYQTLGRALINFGEVKLAVRSFSRAIILNPANWEVRSEDLPWATRVLSRQPTTSREAEENGQQSQDRMLLPIKKVLHSFLATGSG